MRVETAVSFQGTGKGTHIRKLGMVTEGKSGRHVKLFPLKTSDHRCVGRGIMSTHSHTPWLSVSPQRSMPLKRHWYTTGSYREARFVIGGRKIVVCFERVACFTPSVHPPPPDYAHLVGTLLFSLLRGWLCSAPSSSPGIGVLLFDARPGLGRRAFATRAEGADLEILVLGYHDGQDFQDVFGDGVIVDVDE